jgi:hypothetical protein
MASIAGPVIPEFLYRYRPLRDETVQREIDAIKSPYIWCSHFTELNDPMEGYFSKKNQPLLKSSLDCLDAISDPKIDVGIGALSDTFTNDLLWAHYASNWAGICVAYRAETLIHALPDDATIVHLAYDDTPAELDTKDAVKVVKKGLSHKRRAFGPTSENGACSQERGRFRLAIRKPCTAYISVPVSAPATAR